MGDISEADVVRYWNENSSVWSDQVRKGYDFYRELLNNPSMFALIGHIQGMSVLDAECGEGHNTRKLARLGAKVVGIDISSKMIQYALDEERKNPLGIAYHSYSFSAMASFQDSSFDMVVSFMALMDGPDYELAIGEIHRVLKPKGFFVFSITHPCFLTEGMSWIRNDKGEPLKIAIANYFKKEPYIDQWKFSMSPEASQVKEFQVPYFPRTLSDYLNPLLESGFQLVRVREPRPTAEDCQKHPGLDRWRKHAAIFLQIKAQRL